MPRQTIEYYLELGQERQLIEVTDSRIKYTLQGKEYELDPEEQVRAAVYVELVEDYLYSPRLIDFEVEVPRRTPGDFADIVVFKGEDNLENYIVVESKRVNCSGADFEQAIEQGFGNANSLRADFLVVDSFSARRVFDISNYPPNERVNNIIADVPKNYGLVPSYRFIRGGEEDLTRVSFNQLTNVFQKCHDILWSGGRLDPASAFDEMSKLLFAKIQDERSTPNGEPYKFQAGYNENEVIIAKRCHDLYDEARRVDPYVFTESIGITDDKLKAVVDVLQHVSLAETDLDAKGQAFEKFLGVVFRGELGQYFTRRQIVEFVVDVLEPKENDVVLDPSCGSGGFLLYCMKKVAENVREAYEGNNRLIERKTFDFSRQKIYGIDINAKIARVAMMDMIVNDDGHTNIENNTGLNTVFSKPNIRFGRFTLIMTNPPFGVNIKRSDRDNLGQNSFNNFAFGGSRKSQVSDVLFLEQYEKFLVGDTRFNPRLGVVLHVGVLNNPSNKPLLEWLRLHFEIVAVVNLPDFAFRKAGSGMKTCLLFAKKYVTPFTTIEDIPDYEVFFGIANHIGYDSTLRPDTNDLDLIIEHYKNHTEDRGAGTFWLPFSGLDYRLDPLYYFNKFFINEHLNTLKDLGHYLVPLGSLLESMDAGKSPKGGVTRSTGEYPSITISNITKDGTLDFSDNLYFVPDAFYEEFQGTKGGLEFHDIIIAKDGATTGKTAIIDESFPFLDTTSVPPKPRAIFSEHIFRLRFKPNLNPLYVHAFLNSELGRLQLDTVITGGAQGGITRGFEGEIFIPLVNKGTQSSIAEAWAAGIEYLKSLRADYETRIGVLKQEIENAVKSAKPISDEEREELLK